MKQRLSVVDWICAFSSFFIPFLIYVRTGSNALMFDDSAEFALVIKLGSIAHPPGTPAYILFGMLWEKLTSLFHIPAITSLTVFSSLCVSLASFFLFFTFRKIVSVLSKDQISPLKVSLVSVFCVLAFATGATTWSWSNTVEVYAFQILSMSIALFGLTYYHFNRTISFLVASAVGLSFGLGNHHLTMILFLPFVPFFFFSRLFVPGELKTEKSKKKTAATEPGFFAEYYTVLGNSSFWLLAGMTAAGTLFFYGWMYFRAQQEYPFMFGQPDTFSGMFYHMSGGSYSKNISHTSQQIIASRFPFFLKLTAMQLFAFLPFFFLGAYTLLKNKCGRLFWMVVVYFLFLFVYQLNNNQWASTDAYMLLPFVLLSLFIVYGITLGISKWNLTWVLPILLIAQIAYNYPQNNRKSYPVSSDLMHLLDVSSPKNSIILISDWSTVIQYYYYRISENFRPDLVVLNYDLKFTHYRILPILFPEFYSKVKPEYDAFIEALRKEHPEQISNTGCDLSTDELISKFKAVLFKMETVARQENRAFLTDPKTHYFYSTQKLYDPKRYVSGCFSSSLPGDSLSAAEFLKMDFPFLSSPLLYNDAGALDKLVDFQAMLDQHISFYSANKDTLRQMQAEAAKEKVLRIQRDMKRSMSFAFGGKSKKQ